MKAKVFNEEKLIREKMKKMASAHDTKVIQSFVIFIMVGDCFCREKFLNPFSSIFLFISGDRDVRQVALNAGGAGQVEED